jgi:tetratricopeptide (TPR) repeat protein
VFAESKNYDEAFECFDKSIEIDSSLTSNYFHKANLLKELGRLEEAIKYYDIVIDKDPKDFLVNVFL